jgi:hypothetical protein
MRVFRELRNSATGPWLITGLLIANIAASIPFGVSDTTPGSGPNAYEWTITVLFGATVVGLVVSVWLKQIRVMVAALSGALWCGTSVGDYFAFKDVLDAQTVSAFVLLPLGLSLISFSLARVAQVEHQAELDQ